MLDTGVVLRNLNECIKELAAVNKSFAADPQTGRGARFRLGSPTVHERL
jgi:hypothetical protein